MGTGRAAGLSVSRVRRSVLAVVAARRPWTLDARAAAADRSRHGECDQLASAQPADQASRLRFVKALELQRLGGRGIQIVAERAGDRLADQDFFRSGATAQREARLTTVPIGVRSRRSSEPISPGRHRLS